MIQSFVHKHLIVPYDIQLLVLNARVGLPICFQPSSNGVDTAESRTVIVEADDDVLREVADVGR